MPFDDAELSLDGLDIVLPTLEEQARKRAQALTNLVQYVKLCGGTLPKGWDCAMRFRITSRRHGRQGLTTDNYYYSPCGRTFRTHKQVAEFLQLQPVPRFQQKQQDQQACADELPEHFNIISVTILNAASDRTSAAAYSSHAGKRMHSTMTATDAPTGSCLQSSQELRPAVSAPAAVAQAASIVSNPVCSGQQHCPALSAPPAGQANPAKRTKAALVAKYTSSCNRPIAAHTVATSGMSSSSISGSQASSCQTGFTSRHICQAAATAGSADSCGTQLLPVLGAAEPAASTSAGGKHAACVSSKTVTSTRKTQSALGSQPQQQHTKVQVPRRQSSKLPAWKLKLRELTTQSLAEKGIFKAGATAGTINS